MAGYRGEPAAGTTGNAAVERIGRHLNNYHRPLVVPRGVAVVDGPADVAARPGEGKCRPAAMTGSQTWGSCEAVSAAGCLSRLCQSGLGPGADGVRPGRPLTAWACAARALGSPPACGRGSGSCGPAQRRLVHRGRGRTPVYVAPGGRAAAVCPGAGRLLDRGRA